MLILSSRSPLQRYLDLGCLFRLSIFSTRQAVNSISSITILLDNRNGLGKNDPPNLSYLDLMQSRHDSSFPTSTLAAFGGKPDVVFGKPGNTEVRVIVAGSWYKAFGYQRRYMTGNAASTEAFTWNAKA